MSSNISDLEKARNCVHQLVILLKDKQTKDLKGFPIDDEDTLIRYVRSRKYNVEKVCETIIKYCAIQKSHPGIFKSAYPSFSHTKYIIDNNIVSVLKCKNKDGCNILVINTDMWDPTSITVQDILIAVTIVIQELFHTSIDVQINGLAVIFHLKNFGFSQFKQITVSKVKFILGMMRGGSPIRLKNIYLVHQPSLFNYVLAIARPFMTEKIKNRICFFGEDAESLNKEILLKYIPVKWGGELNDTEAFDEEFKKTLYAKDDYYKQFW